MQKILILVMAMVVLSCSKKISYQERAPANNSYFTIEKTLIYPKTPIQSNKITYHAIANDNTPITGLSVVLTASSDSFPNEDLVLNEVTPGIYEGYLSKTDTYHLDIKTGFLTFMPTRSVGDVNVVDNEYCYVNNGLSWTNYNQEGDGSLANPYKICTVDQMVDISLHTDSSKLDNLANSSSFKVMIDVLDVSKHLANGKSEFIIAENPTEPFVGEFDGNKSFIKGFSSTKSEVALFKYVAGGKISNFKYSYSLSGTNAVSIGGLIYEIKSSPNSFELSKIDLTANITTNGQISEIGALIKRATSSNNINVSDIKANVTITAKGKISGIASEVIGVGALKPYFSKISVVANIHLNSMITDSQSAVSGMIGTLNNAKISDSSVTIQAPMASFDLLKVSGISSFLIDSSIDNSYSIGQVNVNNIALYGGLASEQTNSQIRSSFSLVNVNGSDCSEFCGKTIGKINGGISTVMSDLYSSNQTILNLASISGTNTIVETSVDTVSNPTYFYQATSVPMNIWDFTTVWQQNASLTPSLR